MQQRLKSLKIPQLYKMNLNKLSCLQPRRNNLKSIISFFSQISIIPIKRTALQVHRRYLRLEWGYLIYHIIWQVMRMELQLETKLTQVWELRIIMQSESNQQSKVTTKEKMGLPICNSKCHRINNIFYNKCTVKMFILEVWVQHLSPCILKARVIFMALRKKPFFIRFLINR